MRFLETCLMAAGLLVPVTWPGSAAGQRAGLVTVEGVLSPTVFATGYARAEGGVAREVVLVVLWRGKPGWTEGPIHGTSVPFDASPSELRTARRDLLEAGYRIGPVNLTLSFNPASRSIRVQDQEVNLGEDNVVLVDSVDAARSFRVVGTLRIDPAVVPETDLTRAGGERPSLDLARLIGRSGALKDFLAGVVRR